VSLFFTALYMFYYLSILFVLHSSLLFAQSAYDIIKKAEEHSRGNTSIATMSIQVVRPSWTRTISMKAWTKGNDYSIILIQSPAKEKGTIFLKRKKEVWNWIPSIERTIKMPPSMMNQSWMGTDFTTDDLVKEASILNDYTHKIIGDTIIDSRNSYVIELIPKSGSAVVWGKVITIIDKKDYILMNVKYFDEAGVLVNTLQCRDIRDFNGRLLPATMEMTPSDKDKHRTIMTYSDIIFNKPIDDAFFSVNTIQMIK
jgi:outer membrane lipoprotein-sorting protein